MSVNSEMNDRTRHNAKWLFNRNEENELHVRNIYAEIKREKDLNCRTHGELHQQKERKNKNGRVVHAVVVVLVVAFDV